MIGKLKRAALAMGLFIGLSFSSNASLITEFEMELVVDNDFAVFSGNSSGVSQLLYQNNVIWGAQALNLSALTFNLAAGDDVLYILAMDAGGATGIGGTINGVNIRDTSVDVTQSNNIRAALSGYDSTVSNGSYNVILTDVQNAFSSISFSTPTASTGVPVIPPINTIFGGGFVWTQSEAVLFKFNAADLDIATEVPEPSAIALFMLGIIAIFRKRIL